MSRLELSASAALLVFAAVPVHALQDFGNEWVRFTEDPSRLDANPGVGASDQNEKDYAIGDFDKDGDTDLACVRKQPLHTTGRRRNVLFMNENGVLVDRSVEYATATDVFGDRGFRTRTNDRDVRAIDVDLDGWLDLVTSTTLSPDQPKYISHPRVYMNLGEDTNGDWLGFRHESDRIPQLLLDDGTPSWPRFTAVGAGDVTGDGYPDLYFGDNDDAPGFGGGDMNDRLLVNDGTGHFVDETGARFPAAQTALYTTSAMMADVNGDGLLDIVRNRGLFSPISVAYNDPQNVGFFTLFDAFYPNASYCVNVGDINFDGRLDLIVSDNNLDSIVFNRGNNPDGTVDWSSPMPFAFLTGGDDGFGANSYIVDLDGDLANDVVICDFDVQLPGCNRRTHVYHNPGGALGGDVIPVEEAEAPGFGWRGAAGLLPPDLNGTHDSAIFDLDGDGDLDVVFGRCDSTNVWVNASEPVGTDYCFCDASGPCGNDAAGAGCANSTGGGASLEGFGSASVTRDGVRFRALGLPPNASTLLFVSPDAGGGTPFGDGLLCVGSTVIRLELDTANPAGGIVFGPGLRTLGGWTAGDTRRFQVWYRDPTGPCGSSFNLSNAVEVAFTN